MLRTQSFFIPMCAFERSEKGMIFFMSVTKSLNIQGTSMISFDDAIKTAYEEVATSIDHIFDVEVIGLKCTVQNHKIQEYIADTKIYFKIDTERARENGRD